MKQFLLLVNIVTLIGTNVFAQKKDGIKINRQTFEDVRSDDFKKLVGTESNFEGFSVKYDKDKTALLGSGGFYTYKSKHILMLGGSLGTSTDITNLFNQEVLPTFSVTLSYNMLLPWTRYYYDGEFTDNKTHTKASEIVTNDSRFSYRNITKKNMLKGLEQRERIYTCKRLGWMSIASKYSNDQYGFIDYTRVFKAQQYDTAFQTFSGQLTLHGYMGWNHDDYKWNSILSDYSRKLKIRYRPNYIYGSVFGRISRGNNIADIKKTTVYDLERSDYDTLTKVLRQSGKSKSYYKGNYYEFSTTTIGARMLLSPFNHITFDLSAETNFIRSSDKNNFNLNDYSVLSAGFFVYTGSKDAFKLNIGLAIKRQQSSMTKDWQDRLELITSIPIGPIM